MSELNLELIRAQFPALSQELDGQRLVFLDNPGGTQVPSSVIEAVSHYYREQNANVGGAFQTSLRTDAVLQGARQAMADLLNAPSPETIVFGANMTTLSFHLARSITNIIRPGDEIVVTCLDHDANVTPWADLEAVGAIIRVVDIRTEDCTLDMRAFENAITRKTKLVAVTHASNAVGTIPEVAVITRMAHDVGALVFVDAVQYVPHGPTDVQALDCDFLVCSAYKFFGPHVGVLYGKAEHLDRLTPHKVRPAKNSAPHRWETGTLNHEGIAGTAAAVHYLAELVEGESSERAESETGSLKRRALVRSMTAIKHYEEALAAQLIAGLQRLGDITIYGITDPARYAERVPTVAFTWPRLTPCATAEHLAKHGVCCWSGNYYALRLMERLGLEANGGAVRIGLAHYNTVDEIDILLNALESIA